MPFQAQSENRIQGSVPETDSGPEHFVSDFAIGSGMFVNMSESDLHLLTRYSSQRAEDAFTEIVRRHVDLVHSAALRQVRSPELAEEVAQSVFIELARRAGHLPSDTVVGAWLYNQTRRRAIDVVRREAGRRLREQTAQELQAMNATAEDWTHVEPLLDEAMDALEETDRVAVLLRYFQNKPLRQVGETMGVTDDAAQKRVSRAVERLREFFVKHGINVGASGLVIIISANAVQAAPAALVITISNAAICAGATFATAGTAAATTTKAITMTTLQKTFVAATLAATIGAGIYEAGEASALRARIEVLRQQQVPLAEQNQQLQRKHDDAATRLAQLETENGQLKAAQTPAELLRLRGEVTQLKAAVGQIENDPTQAEAAAVARRVKELQEWLGRTPDETIPELQLLSARDWIFRAVDVPSDHENESMASRMRSDAKMMLAKRLGTALSNYLIAKNAQLPNDLSELKPYFASPINDAILQRYELLRTGNLRDLPPTESLIAEKTPIKNGRYDALFKIGAFDFSWQGASPYMANGKNSGNPFGTTTELKTLLEKQ
jgi:RNA polymerase sigma factor (sigma-70 family)